MKVILRAESVQLLRESAREQGHGFHGAPSYGQKFVMVDMEETSVQKLQEAFGTDLDEAIAKASGQGMRVTEIEVTAAG